MRKLLNTLYITTPESYLSKDGMNVVVSVNQAEVFRIPIINIESIVTFGYMGASPGLMKLCNDNNVSLTFLSPNGRFVSHIHGQTRGNVLLRKAQYNYSEQDDWSLHISQIIIGGKIQNYRNILRRFVRDNGGNTAVESAANNLEQFKRAVFRTTDRLSLMGVEGMAASRYFEAFPHLIIQQRDGFPFSGRNRRPPKDAVNAMLSLAYTLITNDVVSALETVGLDPYVGFLHTLRPGRASLALDLTEELRAYLGDRFVLSLINRRQITPTDFLYQGEQGITMTDDARRTFITAWQNRKKETLVHPYLGEKIPVGLIPHAQAMLLARYIRNDIDDYPVFLIK